MRYDNSPKPWSIVESSWQTTLILDKNQELIAELSIEDDENSFDKNSKIRDANAKHIVECVNSYTLLEEELEKFRDAVKTAHDVLLTVVNECNLYYKESADIDNYTLDDCYAAIAKIKQLRY